MMKINPERIHQLRQGMNKSGPVFYWMSRDQRCRDNWALLFAQNNALEKKSPVIVVFCLVPEFLGATYRQYSFMLRGLNETEKACERKNIPFVFLEGNPEEKIPDFIKKNNGSCLVTDFDPLKIKRKWKEKVADSLDIPVYEIDAHNIVPCRFVSEKQEYAARTIRPKINRLLHDFLHEFPDVKKHPHKWKNRLPRNDWDSVLKRIKVDRNVGEISWITPGELSAQKMLQEFIHQRLENYDNERNDPVLNGQSNLSPYLHFGQISAQRIAYELMNLEYFKKSIDSFLEELIIRRELSDNFCYYNPQYDSFEGFPDWGKKTLEKHFKDRREYIYTQRQLEYAESHDELWNASQLEMVKKGKMHGYMRMYWAKKILEWSKTPEDALRTAIYLNDKYEIDGRDPNGYAGIAWAIGGTHDRPWGERPVFGTIRYMSYNGCKSKFDVNTYIEKIEKEGKR